MDGYIGSWAFVAEYCVYVFIAVIALLQLSAARWGLRGMSFFRSSQGWGYAFGTIAITGVFIWFFGFTDLDLTQPTFDTPPQITWLLVSASCAILFTLALSSLINRGLSRATAEDDPNDDGIEVLKRMTYLRAVTRYLKRGKAR